MEGQISIEEYLKIKETLEEYREKAKKYDLLIEKINKKLKQSEKYLKKTKSNLKRIILEAKISFLNKLKESDKNV